MSAYTHKKMMKMSKSNISLAPQAITFPKEFVTLSKDTMEDDANIASVNHTF